MRNEPIATDDRAQIEGLYVLRAAKRLESRHSISK
jgi:hypothetical protein